MRWHALVMRLRLARSIGAKLALEKAVGNLGWVYYRTGDFQRSLAQFKGS